MEEKNRIPEKVAKESGMFKKVLMATAGLVLISTVAITTAKTIHLISPHNPSLTISDFIPGANRLSLIQEMQEFIGAKVIKDDASLSDIDFNFDLDEKGKAVRVSINNDGKFKRIGQYTNSPYRKQSVEISNLINTPVTGEIEAIVPPFSLNINSFGISGLPTTVVCDGTVLVHVTLEKVAKSEPTMTVDERLNCDGHGYDLEVQANTEGFTSGSKTNVSVTNELTGRTTGVRNPSIAYTALISQIPAIH